MSMLTNNPLTSFFVLMLIDCTKIINFQKLKKFEESNNFNFPCFAYFISIRLFLVPLQRTIPSSFLLQNLFFTNHNISHMILLSN